MVAVHQFVPTLAPRDAVSGHYMRVRTALRAAGYSSDIYAMDARGELSKEAKPFQSFTGGRAGEPTWLCYHSSIGSPIAEFVSARPEPLIVDYHNITPAAFFDRWEPAVAVYLRAGRRQLRALAPHTTLGIADSAYNAAELDRLGFRPTGVVPILFDRDDLHTEIDEAARDRLVAETPTGSSTWLFVGQVAPHKAQHDIVKALAAYRRLFDPNARLRIVGFALSSSYVRALTEYVDALGLADAVDITGSVADDVLGAYYASADVFVCLSEHEGFCVPLLEAMHHRLPVVAYAAGAVPETLGSGGLLLEQKDPLTVATAIARVMNADTGRATRAALVAAGHDRLHAFDLKRSEATLRDAIETVVGAPVNAHQFVPRFEPSAVGNHMIEVRDALVAAGHRSEIFADTVDPRWSTKGAHHFHEYGRAVPARADDRLIYQVAIGSPVADWLVERSETLIANHHNFTPMHFLQAWDPAATHGVAWGRTQLRRLAGRSALGIADSHFNQLDLEAAGFGDTVVVPVLVDLGAFDAEVDDARLARLRDAKNDGGHDWLFVGRIAPNKCQHDLVAALVAHRRAYGSNDRLHLVGASTSSTYSFALERFVAALGLEDAVEITGSVSSAALAAYYRAADVLVCVSEHEGFCVPLLEAMHHRVPVVAYAAGAIPESVGSGGLVLDRKDPETVAAAVERIVTDESVRAALVAAGTIRCAELDPAAGKAAFVAAVERAGAQ